MRASAQCLGIGQSASSGSSVWNIELTLPICPVQTIEAKPVQINEASGSLCAAKAIRLKRSHSQVLTLGPPEALQFTRHVFWRSPDCPIGCHKFDVDVGENCPFWSEREEQASRPSKGLDVTGRICGKVLTERGQKLAFAPRPTKERRRDLVRACSHYDESLSGRDRELKTFLLVPALNRN